MDNYRIIGLICLMGILILNLQQLKSQTASTEGSSGGGGESLSFQTDLFTGRFSYSVPMTVPPGRGGSEPTVSLAYSSSGSTGWCGVGWNLDVGFIQRDGKNGVPIAWSGANPSNSYDDSKGFVVCFGGVNSKLVHIGGNEYRAQLESAFLKFEYINPEWKITDRSGNQFFFGESSNSRLENVNFVAGGSSVFRWCLNRVIDVNGNTTSVSYVKDGNNPYLSEIAYNGHTSGLSETHKVVFQLEDRSDTSIDYSAGIRVELNKRLLDVTMKVENQFVRRYELIYSSSATTHRSLLKSIRHYGSDNSSTLPETVFSYQQQSQGFGGFLEWGGLDTQGQSDWGWGTLNASKGQASYSVLQDINGDGLPDRVMRKASSPHDVFKVQLNNGSGFDSVIDWTNVTNQGSSASENLSPRNWSDESENNWSRLSLIDINGDALPDRVMRKQSSPYNKWFVQYNNGNGFDSEVEWTGIQMQGQGSEYWNSIQASDSGAHADLIDINGDSLPDRIMRKV
ncbi:MAG: SpvB/TcaC N-terminal domain-containing protein, partial [Verrucomicrobiota bacterium]